MNIEKCSFIQGTFQKHFFCDFGIYLFCQIFEFWFAHFWHQPISRKTNSFCCKRYSYVIFSRKIPWKIGRSYVVSNKFQFAVFEFLFWKIFSWDHHFKKSVIFDFVLCRLWNHSIIIANKSIAKNLVKKCALIMHLDASGKETFFDGMD